ncbi:TCR/Tet family MFS transporter [Pararhizobium sp. A13]|uniref:TCR/Tet family MFS transporter n=1 Tax=Pararhizobium sp. A13 TaxID=3133975 RepID=UPI003249CF01
MIDARSARRGLSLVFLILFLDIMGIAIIVPVLPSYLKELTGDTVSEAAVDGGWLLLVYSGMQFIFAPLIGNLSDRFGRRPILLASVLTFALDNLICALAVSYWMLFVGRVLAGISGASFSTAAAYIADVSDDTNRAKNFGLIGIAFGTGFALGPVLGGLLGEFGPRIPFYGAAALSFVNFLVALFLLPETLESHNRRRFEWKRANPLGALKQMRNYPGIGWVLLVFFLFWQAHAVYPAVWSFVASYRYNWSEGQIGLSLGIFGICGALVMAFVLPKAIPMLGEWKTGAVGLIFTGLGLIGYALSSQGWMIYAVILLTCLEALADPPLRSIASARVPPSAQGELQGALSSISSFTTILGPLIFAHIFSVFTAPQASVVFAGAPYVLAAVFVAAAVAIYLQRVRPASVPADGSERAAQSV